jgi:hypothetical protein
MNLPQEQFKQRMLHSCVAVNTVCDWLSKRGYDAEPLPFEVAPDHSQWKEYADDGDIRIRIRGRNYRYEVKHRKLKFDSIASYPYESIIVDERYKIEKPHELPLWGYGIVNADRSCMISIPAATERLWFDRVMFDRHYQTNRTFTHCPINKALKFVRLT